jgi:hypothetical protein
MDDWIIAKRPADDSFLSWLPGDRRTSRRPDPTAEKRMKTALCPDIAVWAILRDHAR